MSELELEAGAALERFLRSAARAVERGAAAAYRGALALASPLNRTLFSP